MQTFNKAEKPHWAEYIFRFAIPAGLIFGGIKLFNYIAPDIISFFDSFWKIVALGVPAAMLVLYVISNPKFIWMSYKNLCRKVTGFFIKLDFLSYMESYVEILRTKHANLRKSKTFIMGKRTKLQAKVNDYVKAIDTNLRKGQAARELGDSATAAHLGSLASGDKESLMIYKPMLERLDRNITFLDKLDENWSRGIEKLDHEIKRMRDQYETMKEMAAAVNMAEDFANGNTEEAKLYKMSVEAFQENLSQKIAAIEEFEKNSKQIMSTMDLEKQMEKNDGINMLDQYIANGSSIFLPESDLDMNNMRTKDFAYTGSPISRGNTAGTNEFQSLLK